MAEEAVELGNAIQMDVSTTEELLSKIKDM